MSTTTRQGRGWATAALAPVLLLAAACTSGCTSQFATGVVSIDACRAAETVTTTPADDISSLNEALIDFAASLPSELQSHALLLAQPLDSEAGPDTLEKDRHARLLALAELQGWTIEACESYLTIGAPAEDELTPETARLADFETVVGSDEQGTYVSVLGVRREDIALALCEQALREHALPAQAGAAVHVQVVDPIGQPLVSSNENECAAVAQ